MRRDRRWIQKIARFVTTYAQQQAPSTLEETTLGYFQLSKVLYEGVLEMSVEKSSVKLQSQKEKTP